MFLGIDKYGSYIEAEVKDGLIRGFNGYNYVGKSESYDNNEYMVPHSWTHEVEIGGIVFKSGMAMPKDLPKVKKKDKTIFERSYKTDGSYCDDCGKFHDQDQYYDVSYVVSNDGIFCKECAKSEQLLEEVNNASDLFQAKDITNMANPKGYRKVTTLFCDSSGWGRAGEAALTKEQAEQKMQELLDKYGQLYVGLTGIGQFQVYVTVYRKVISKVAA